MKWLVTLKKNNKNKYLALDDVNENKEVSKKYEEIWDGVKKEIETINGGKKVKYGKDYMKIRFNTNDDLPLSKAIKLHFLTIIIRCVISEDGKFYPQLFLVDTLYELV